MIAPTLIVGLGGTGCKVAVRVAKKTNDEQRKRVRFVCIDTDVNDLRRLKEDCPFVTTIQTSAPYTVGEYLENNHLARDTWFPTHHIMNSKSPTEGAGQVRAISRLAFDTCVKEGAMQPLEKAIEELYPLSGDAAQQALRVIVVSSLAGGTGSGVILPCAIYIKNYLEKHFKRSASVMRGFLMLPDIFFGGKSPEEITNLSCNGYAALRELDAFMRRSDNDSSSVMYRDLSMLLPDPSTNEYVDYRLAPFNFCFLFGAQNTSDQQLANFDEYMSQAANIVYAQSISALSGRSNSSEDNTILTLCAGHGHNRFCGAGSSNMLYPKDGVVRYLADRWALDNMGEDWLYFDNKYTEYRRQQERAQERDPNVAIMAPGEHYVQTVESDTTNRLAGLVRREATDKSALVASGVVGRWEGYVAALGEAITKATHSQAAYDSVKKSVEGKIDDLADANRDELNANGTALYNELMRFHDTAVSSAGLAASTVASNYIYNEVPNPNDSADIQHWLVDAKGNFIHPASFRYFLYGTQKKVEDLIANTKKSLEKAKKDQKVLVDTVDDPNTEEIETINEYPFLKHFGPLTWKSKGAIADIQDASTQYITACQSEYEETARLKVLEELQQHIAAMIKGVENFFNGLRTNLEKTRRDSEELYGRYENGEGHATYYVCADKICLDAMAKELTCRAAGFDGAISREIFNEIRSMVLSGKGTSSKRLSEMYDDEIMGYWKRSVLDTYGSALEVTVIDALMNEARYHSGKADMDNDEAKAYCRERMQAAAKMAEPFIEKPQGETRHTVNACCFSRGVDEKYHDFVTTTLNGEGGVPDGEVPDEEIIFYHAIYGIRAVDLQQFAPELNTRTLKRRPGIYYAAYKNRIRNLGPVLSKNDDITPHIDRNWHLAKYMPDLSDEVHEQEIKDVYRAMVWGLLSEGLITYDPADNLYLPESNDNRDFVVPSTEGDAAKANPCDKLSELVDALSVNPPQVRYILNSLDRQIETELRDRKPFGETMLARRLRWFDAKTVGLTEQKASDRRFRVEEFASAMDASVFDLLYWVKYSTPVDDYDVNNMNLLRDAIIELLEYYIGYFVPENVRNNACALVMVDQLKQFTVNLMADGPETQIKMADGKSMPANRIMDETVRMVTSALKSRFRDEYLIDSEDLREACNAIDAEVKRISDIQKRNPFSC